MIRTLPPEYLRGVWEIVSDGNTSSQSKEELEFDIDKLSVRTTRELEHYVRSKLSLINKKRKIKQDGTGKGKDNTKVIINYGKTLYGFLSFLKDEGANLLNNNN